LRALSITGIAGALKERKSGPKRYCYYIEKHVTKSEESAVVPTISRQNKKAFASIKRDGISHSARQSEAAP
jgi:hypothetical protein